MQQWASPRLRLVRSVSGWSLAPLVLSRFARFSAPAGCPTRAPLAKPHPGQHLVLRVSMYCTPKGLRHPAWEIPSSSGRPPDRHSSARHLEPVGSPAQLPPTTTYHLMAKHSKCYDKCCRTCRFHRRFHLYCNGYSPFVPNVSIKSTRDGLRDISPSGSNASFPGVSNGDSY